MGQASEEARSHTVLLLRHLELLSPAEVVPVTELKGATGLSLIAYLVERVTPEVAVLLVSALPVVELRGAIPLGVSMGLEPARVYALSVVGNIAPILPILVCLEYLAELLSRFGPIRSCLEWVFVRTRIRGVRVEKYGALGILLLVAIPLPTTGVWTASVATFLFRIRWKYAVPAMCAGVLVAGVVVLALTCGARFVWL